MKLEQLLPSVAKMELIHPGTGPTGIYFNLIGQDSKAFRDKARAIAKSLNAKQKDVDFTSLEDKNDELIATCVVGWSDTEAFGEYSPARALEIIKMDELSWIKEEVEAFIKERANFFQRTPEITD